MGDSMAKMTIRSKNGSTIELEGDSAEEVQKMLNAIPKDSWLADTGYETPAQQKHANTDSGQPTARTIATQDEANLKTVIELNSKGEIEGLKIKLPLRNGDERTGEAALLLIFAASIIERRDSVLGGNLLSWLKHTGYTDDRADRPMMDFITKGEVLASGQRRGRAYRLTQSGKLHAKEILSEINQQMA